MLAQCSADKAGAVATASTNGNEEGVDAEDDAGADVVDDEPRWEPPLWILSLLPCPSVMGQNWEMADKFEGDLLCSSLIAAMNI